MTKEWDRSEREADEDMRMGRVKSFSSMGELIEELHSDIEWKDGGLLGNREWCPGPDCQTFRDVVKVKNYLVCRHCNLPLRGKVDSA